MTPHPYRGARKRQGIRNDLKPQGNFPQNSAEGGKERGETREALAELAGVSFLFDVLPQFPRITEQER